MNNNNTKIQDLLSKIQQAAGGISEIDPSRGQLTDQQEQLNALRMEALQGAMGGEVQQMTSRDHLNLGLNNVLKSLVGGGGISGGIAGYNDAATALNARQQAAALEQANTVSQLANQTQLESPETNLMSDAIKVGLTASNLENDDLKREFSAAQSQLERQFKERVALQTVEAKQREAELNRQNKIEVQNLKNNQQIDKENRKLAVELTDAEYAAEEQLTKLLDAYQTFQEYSKNNMLGTGPFATRFGTKKWTDESTQLLDAKFKGLNLDTMVKMFAGMSKAVDSDAERRAFESAQPSITNDDKVNEELFKQKIDAVRSLIMKTKRRRLELDPRYKRMQELKQKYGR